MAVPAGGRRAGGVLVYCLKFSQGLTVPKFTVCTIVGMVLSFVFLSQATKVLPLGTSYAIWTGIGALGAVVVGVVIFHESSPPPGCCLCPSCWWASSA